VKYNFEIPGFRVFAFLSELIFVMSTIDVENQPTGEAESVPNQYVNTNQESVTATIRILLCQFFGSLLLLVVLFFGSTTAVVSFLFLTLFYSFLALCYVSRSNFNPESRVWIAFVVPLTQILEHVLRRTIG
jgi:hypothetical protein